MLLLSCKVSNQSNVSVSQGLEKEFQHRRIVYVQEKEPTQFTHLHLYDYIL